MTDEGAFFFGLTLGVLLSASVALPLYQRLKKMMDGLEFPTDSLITFQLFDSQGEALTDRELIFLGEDGSNKKPIYAHVKRSGMIHHGVMYVGDYGSVVQLGGDARVVVGDTFAIPPGRWSTVLEVNE